MNVKLDMAALQSMALFEKLTHAQVQDCILGESHIFVVKQGEIAKALGKNAATLHKAEHVFKKKIKLIEFNADLAQFVKNAIAPLKVASVVVEDGVVTISDPDMKVKGMIIGRSASNLNKLKDLVRRYFTINDIVVK